MVVSGMPERNGDLHAGEISTMSLHLLSSITSFCIPHMPDKKLQLRIGLHTGTDFIFIYKISAKNGTGLILETYCAREV